MPEEEKKTVDIDTSGPETEINVPEEKDEAVVDTAPETTEQETETETKVETEKKSDEELEDLLASLRKLRDIFSKLQ